MSKINIGVGDDFPLDESPAGRDACKDDDHHAMHRLLRALRHAHHEHRHHGHGHHRHHGCRGRGPEAE